MLIIILNSWSAILFQYEQHIMQKKGITAKKYSCANMPKQLALRNNLSW